MFTPLSPTQLASQQANKELNKRKNLNKSVRYIMAWLPAFALASLAGMLKTVNREVIFFILQFLYLVMGYVHMRLMYKYLPHMEPTKFNKGFWFTILMILIGVASSVLMVRYGLKSKNAFFYPTATLLFPVAYLVKKAFDAFIEIPHRQYKKWYYPLTVDAPDRDFIDLSVILIVHLNFTKRQSEKSLTTFTAKAPLNMAVGTLFQIFINDYNERNEDNPIQYVDDSRMPHGWLFFVNRGFWKKKFYLDPELTFKENNITDKESIFAIRFEGIEQETGGEKKILKMEVA
jgi:Type VI secretion system, TssN